LGFGEEYNSFKFIFKRFSFSGLEIMHSFRFHVSLGKIMPFLRKIFHIIFSSMKDHAIELLRMTKILLDMGLLHHVFTGKSSE